MADETAAWLQQLEQLEQRPAASSEAPPSTEARGRAAKSDMKGFVVEGEIGEATILVLDDASIFEAAASKHVRLVAADHASEAARAQVQRDVEQQRRGSKDANPFASQADERRRLKAAKQRLVQKIGANGVLKPTKKTAPLLPGVGADYRRVDLTAAPVRTLQSDVAPTSKRAQPEPSAAADSDDQSSTLKRSRTSDEPPTTKLSLADELLNDLLSNN